MLIFGDTLMNMKTENRWKKKIRAQPWGAKKSLTEPEGEKENS